MTNSNKIREIMEMVNNVVEPNEEDFYTVVRKLTEYGVPENVIEDLINRYEAYGETQHDAGWESGQNSHFIS